LGASLVCLEHLEISRLVQTFSLWNIMQLFFPQQAGAQNISFLFGGRFVCGLSIGILSMVV
jgi:hypothetical protein